MNLLKSINVGTKSNFGGNAALLAILGIVQSTEGLTGRERLVGALAVGLMMWGLSVVSLFSNKPEK